MIKNYLLTTWRNLRRNKLFTLINLFGLAVGLACFLLIALYVLDETSYDTYNVKAGRLYRINTDGHWGGADLQMAETPDITGPVMKREFPGVEEMTRIYPHASTRFIRKGDQYIPENSSAWVDSTFFDLFTLPAVDGNTHSALTEPHAVVITATTAQKYFGTPMAAGRTLDIRENGKIVPYTVRAVIRDVPENSHFRYDLFFAMKGLDYGWNQPGNHNFSTYVLLKPGVSPGQVEANFDSYLVKYLLPELKNFQITSMEQFRQQGNRLRYFLLPVTSIHLYSHNNDELRPPGNIQYVYSFAVVAAFILLIACVNFMNLTTARSAGRAKEVGIRKVLGTSRRELIRQFLTESTVLVTASLIIGIGLAALGLPLFNSLAEKQLSWTRLFSPALLIIIALLPLSIGLLAGSYPAFFLSAFRPIEVLKDNRGNRRLRPRYPRKGPTVLEPTKDTGAALVSKQPRRWSIKTGSGGSRLRSILVVFQFTTSIILMIGTLVVYRQLSYMRGRDLGFSRQQVLIIDGMESLGDRAIAFKQEVGQWPAVKSATLSTFLPVSASNRNSWNVFKGPGATAAEAFNTQFWTVDYDYLPTMGMHLVRGRNFSKAFAADDSSVIVNETVARMLGPGDAVGKNIYTTDDKNVAHPHLIVGVVQNFNFESMHQSVGPLIMQRWWNDNGTLSIRLGSNDVAPVIEHLRTLWRQANASTAFQYRFLDQAFDQMYKADEQVGNIALVFASLALLIGCMGIFGLAAFIAERRTKEIGIRKVLGASTGGILGLLSGEFTRLVMISFVIAAPLAGWMMSRWLQDFAYRTTIAWWVFLVAGVATFLIALVTVSFQSLKAALADPVQALRAE